MAVITINGREFPAPDVGGNLVVTDRIPDMVNNRFQTIRMYPGNRTATPVEFNGSGLPTKYRDCKVNIIDCGVIE